MSIHIMADPALRLIPLNEAELARNNAAIDLRKSNDQIELERLTGSLIDLLRNPDIGSDVKTLIDGIMRRPKDVSVRFRIALRMAESKIYLDSVKEKARVGIVFAVHNVCRNRMMRQSENPKEGEDALRVKIHQLNYLFGDNPNLDWQVTIVDDGSTDDQSGIYAESILKDEYPDLYSSGKVRVLYPNAP